MLPSLALVLLAIASSSAAPHRAMSHEEYDTLVKKRDDVLKTMSDAEDPVINIKELGAVGDGKHNDTGALFIAMEMASSGLLSYPVLIPEGTFLMWPVVLPCKNARLTIRGTVLVAQADDGWTQNEYFWKIDDAENCTITGTTDEFSPPGVISGQGERWWEKGGDAPALILFQGTGMSYPYSGIYNISLNNAPGTHILVRDSYWYGGPVFSGVWLYSPAQSKNVIGIHAINASFRLTNSEIATSGPNLLIECGRGEMNRAFAVSEGSRFGHGQGIVLVMYDGVMGNVSFFNSEFQGTTYGLRVLGAVDGTGWVSNIQLFETKMIDVGTPLQVDNTACPLGRHDCTGKSQGGRMVYSGKAKANQKSPNWTTVCALFILQSM